MEKKSHRHKRSYIRREVTRRIQIQVIRHGGLSKQESYTFLIIRIDLHLVEDTSHDRESEGQEGARGHGGAGVVDWHGRRRGGGSRALHQRSRAHGSHGSRHHGRNSGHGGHVNGSCVGRGDVHRDIGGGRGGCRLGNGSDHRLSGRLRDRDDHRLSGRLGNRNDHGLSGRLGDGNNNRLSCGLRNRHNDRLGAWVSVVRLVGSSTIDSVRSAGNANIVASAGILLGARSWAAGTVLLTVDTSTKGDVRSTGNADIVARTSILLGVTRGGSVMRTAEKVTLYFHC